MRFLEKLTKKKKYCKPYFFFFLLLTLKKLHSSQTSAFSNRNSLIFYFVKRSPSCRSVIEIIDPNTRKKTVLKLCSPVTRKARNEMGSFIPPQTFISTGNQMIIVLRRAGPPHDANDIEFVDGAFLFHNEEQSGTLQPYSLCDMHHYGLSSPESGSVEGPGN